MFSKRFKKALSVIAASAVIASCTSATMPVSAFVDSPGITQVYSIKNYDAEREFSVKRLGSLHSYSFNTLYMGCGSNDRIPTGIWASEGMKLKVYVKAQNGDAIPKIMFTQHLTAGNSQKIIQLENGINEITVPAVTSSVESGYEQGGTVYLVNDYTEA